MKRGIMARKSTNADKLYNARRRYRRQAERYMKQAQKTSGIEKQRFEALAYNATISAANTYNNSSRNQQHRQISGLMQQLHINPTDINNLIGTNHNNTSDYRTNLIEQRSERALSQNLNLSNRDEMTKQILSTGNIGTRFYGGLSDVWVHSPEDKQHPNEAIMNYFGVNSIMDVIELIEEQGINLYAPDVNPSTYRTIELQLQQFISTYRNAKRKK